MANKNPTKELEYKLRQQLNNFNPEEVESYLEVMLRKCLEATIEKDYLALGSVEELLNKSIVILSSEISNFNIMYSNIKLKVATEYLAKYIELDNTEAFKFFNVLPEFVEEPEVDIGETKEEVAVEMYYKYLIIKNGYSYLNLLLGFLYMLIKGIEETEIAKKIEASFGELIELIYINQLKDTIQELESYSSYIKKINYDIYLASEEENKVNYSILYYYKEGLEFKEKLEELEANPFKDVADYLVLDWIALVFGLREPLESIDSFRATLTEEKDIAVLNCLIEGFTSNIATYDFNNFKIIPPKEIEADPEEHEIIVPEGFEEAKQEYYKNLPDWLKDRFNIKTESEEEDLPTNEDSSENDVPINEA